MQINAESSHQTGWVEASDGVRLYARWWKPSGAPKAIVCLVHGGCEHSGRYAHVAKALARSGYALSAVDLRGHGRSPGRRVFIRAFDEYLTDVRERDPIYAREGLGHPGLLQRVMNKVLVDNAILGPWIHVGSRMQLLSAGKAGDKITARAKVTGNYEKKGHRFVELDALVVANGKTPLAHCQHIAIYQPREQAAA